MRSSSIDAALTPPEPFSALLFDCDGTLVDSVSAYERAWERAFAPRRSAISWTWSGWSDPMSGSRPSSTRITARSRWQSSLGDLPPASLGQRLRGPGPRPDRHRGRPAGDLPTLAA